MAFTLIGVLPTVIGKTVVLHPAADVTVLAGATQADAAITFFNPGGIGALRKILILVEATSASGTPTFSMFWKGAVDFDGILATTHLFWTGVPSSTSNTASMYYGDNEGSVNVLGGVGAASLYMFSLPYLGLGISNTGATDCTYGFTLIGELV